ncbi:hypothetical protein [Corynebacterium amycolatum]|uniref:hypothetical protein n=1 Tax=Corynebacterium amycolatum TaxID=43765 RepID=UPI000E17C0BF|nr:hypothetical protein [Corynebacterium amycolatum]STC40428.1 Uncharacterised protein [Corynebacterium amycolatum]
MGVAPGGSNPRPEGSLSPSGLQELASYDEDFIKKRTMGILKSSAEEARNGFVAGLRHEVFAPLAQAFTGSEGDLPDLTTAITDQQSKTQELWDERGRAAVFSSANLAYRGDQSIYARMRIPFTEQVGPMIGAEIDPKGGLILKTPGSWLIIAKVGVSGTRAFGQDWQRMWIEARKGGWRFAESWATSIAGVEQATMLDIMPVVISPEQAEHGVSISVFQDAGRHRYLLGGHGYTLLFAQKLSSTREMSTVDPGDPGIFEEENP